MEEFCKWGSYSLISNRTPSELIDFMNEYKIVQILNNFQRNPIPYQKNMSVSNIIEKYTNSSNTTKMSFYILVRSYLQYIITFLI